MSVINNIQMNSAIYDKWSDYNWCLKCFNQTPSKQFLIELNKAVDEYRHTLNVYRPTKQEIESAISYVIS